MRANCAYPWLKDSNLRLVQLETMSQQYIFTIESLTRIHDQKEVLHDIWMAFFPGAKIGVLGNNGAGKSSLLRIMAGEDDGYEGTARPAKGIKIGYFPQEPRLDDSQCRSESLPCPGRPCCRTARSSRGGSDRV